MEGTWELKPKDDAMMDVESDDLFAGKSCYFFSANAVLLSSTHCLPCQFSSCISATG